jgi:HK97 family phage major capsid protein
VLIAMMKSCADLGTIRRHHIEGERMQYNKKPIQHGEAFALVALALVDAKGRSSDLEREADRYRYSHPEVASFLKAAVAEGTTTDANWGGPLAQYRAIADEFLAVVRARSVIGRLSEARHVPLNTRAALEYEPAIAYWTAQGAPKPISRLTFSEMTSLAPRKCSIIVVLSDELVRATNGTAAMQRALVRHLTAALDRALLDPSFGTSTSSPTSVTANGTVVTPTGTSAIQIAADLESMAIAVAAGSEFDSPVFILSPLTAAKLGAHRDTSGAAAFADVRAVTGGSLIGIPVIVSGGTKSADSPSDDNVILLNQSSLIIGDDNEVIVGATTQASLQMDNAPGAGAQSHVSLWQADMVGIRVERFLNWATARAGAAASLVVTF